MGVTGLWKLIEPCGKPVPVETLEGKILAVDISIWLHQVVKGFQDNKGSALANAHLLGLFHRLCKLLYYRVRPVFVFDGCMPELKQDTIARRQLQRSKLNNEADRIQALLLQSLAKEKVVQQALGANAEMLLKSPVKRLGKSSRSDDAADDMFKLPELPAPLAPINESNTENGNNEENDSHTSFESGDYSSTDDSSFDANNPRHYYNANLQAIDVRSEHFRHLPADVRHEILVDIKETRKQSSWGRLHELPSRSDDFSTFQMKRLLKRRAVQESLEEAEQEMGGRTLTFGELQNFFTEEGILERSELEKATRQISSDENTRYLLVRDLKKKLLKIDESTEKEDVLESSATNMELKETAAPPSDFKEIVEPPSEEEVAPSASTGVSNDSVESSKKSNLGRELDIDLELATAMSLEETQVYNKDDYVFESRESLKLNPEQRKELRNANKGPARAYMIEYGGMNEDEVVGILEKTQENDVRNEHLLLNSPFPNDTRDGEVISNGSHEKTEVNLEPVTVKSNNASNNQSDPDEDDLETIRLHVSTESEDDLVAEGDLDIQKQMNSSQDTNGSDFHLHVTSESETEVEPNKVSCLPKPNESNIPDIRLIVSSDSDSDDDFVEVVETTIKTDPQKNEVKLPEKQALEIVVKTNDPIEPEEDLFADIFEPSKGEQHQHLDVVNPVLANSNGGTEKGDDVAPTAAGQIADNKNLIALLDNLKRQIDDVKLMSLDDIKLNTPVELNDGDILKINESPLKAEIKSEIVEIIDSDDGCKAIAEASKSPKLKTPSKNKISTYFPKDYVIKRTPDKVEEVQDIPKVASPFFVKRTPKSQRKRKDESITNATPPSSAKKSKASKSLFPNEESSGEEVCAEPPRTTEDLIQDAANLLKDQKTEEELQALASDLAKQRSDLESERNRQDRMGMSISQRMNAECQQLLKLFGVPYVVAPMEAEAQCAFLDAVELTNGTITDDSDIWLFGGRTVYKNFFAQNKHVLEFRANQIEQSFNCDRKKLIQLACLVGSDYTMGVHGIGAVTALEILASFSPPKEGDDQRNAVINITATLKKFRDWWLASQKEAMPPGSSARLSLRRKLKNIELHQGFPSMAVVEAYLTPKVDESKEAFMWGYPDVESIREFARKTFGWTTTKTDDTLQPVLKKLNEKKSQVSIRNYFSVKSKPTVRQLKVSKRVQSAIDKMSGLVDAETPEKPVKAKRTKATKRKKAACEAETSETSSKEVEEVQKEAEKDLSLEPSTSRQALRGPQRKPRIPNTKQIIPQKEKDIEQLRINKQKAIEIMKKDGGTAEKKKKTR